MKIHNFIMSILSYYRFAINWRATQEFLMCPRTFLVLGHIIPDGENIKPEECKDAFLYLKLNFRV